MTSNATLDKDDLVQVLGRINRLIERQNENAQERDVDAVALEDDIPLLTSRYEGDAALTHAQPEQVSQLLHAAADASQPKTKSQPAIGTPLSDELATQFLAQVQPMILKAIKVAVLEESVKAEKQLTEKLEQEILLLLRNRLTANIT